MRPAGTLGFALLLLSLCLPLHAKSKHLTVTGKLTHGMTVGAESTGWSIQLNPVITVDGRQLSSLEIETSHAGKLQSLQDRFVEASGTLVILTGVETGDRPVLHLSSIHTVKTNNPEAEKSKLSFWSAVLSFFSLSPI
jgi:uncharacterized protein involved in outer membrane biogenesis